MKTNTSPIDKLTFYGSILLAVTPALALIIMISSVIL